MPRCEDAPCCGHSECGFGPSSPGYGSNVAGQPYLGEDRSRLHLVGVDTLTNGVISLDRCAEIGEAIEKIAAYCTHQEDDPAVSVDVVSGAWADHVLNGGDAETFLFSRGRGRTGHTVYSLIFTEV